MNTHELPMIIFTVLGQMSVGAFVVLGVVQVFAARRFGAAAVDKVTDPALYAIGPALVLGLGASMLHMNDVMNTLNVFRHLGSSWLSREIVCGVVFAGLGFVFAAVFTGGWFIARLVLVFAGAGLVAVNLFRYATTRANPRTLAVLAGSAFLLVLAGELIGRSLFYDSMLRIGM